MPFLVAIAIRLHHRHHPARFGLIGGVQAQDSSVDIASKIALHRPSAYAEQQVHRFSVRRPGRHKGQGYRSHTVTASSLSAIYNAVGEILLTEPSLLSLQGRVDHQALEDAIAAVRAGAYPGWTVVQDKRRDARAGWRHIIAAIASIVFGMFNQPATGPFRTIVVAHTPSSRRMAVVFAYLGEANGLPLWSRV